MPGERLIEVSDAVLEFSPGPPKTCAPRTSSVLEVLRAGGRPGPLLDSLRSEGAEASEGDVGGLSLLRHEHANLLGRYRSSLSEDPRRGGLREPGASEE